MDYLTHRRITHGITIYTTYIRVDLTQHGLFRAKVGKGGIISNKRVFRKSKVYDI